MLDKFLKICFMVAGAVTGFTVAHLLFPMYLDHLPQSIQTVAYACICLAAAALSYAGGSRLIRFLARVLDRAEAAIQRLQLLEMAICLGGITCGLIIANLLTIPVVRIDIIGVPLAVLANILLGCIGGMVAYSKRGDFPAKGEDRSSSGERRIGAPKLVDTSTVIDGRIFDICRSGFLEGALIVPQFVLEELRYIADSPDPLKRNRGRRGLDILHMLQKDLEYPVKVSDISCSEDGDVDSKLMEAAKKLNAAIITNDYNLNKVAVLQGIQVLNINELANAVKPIALPGEELSVKVVKDGRENGQGIAYLEDGTMIVVEGGKQHIGEELDVMVTSVLQTAAGKMVFARPKLDPAFKKLDTSV